MQSNRIIGGEFDFDLQSLQYVTSGVSSSLDSVYKYSSGRSALYYILLDVQERYGINTVYLPDYLCSSIIIATEKSQMNVVLYSLNDELEIAPEVFPLKENEKAAVLVINYFGLKNTEPQIKTIRSISPNAIIIEDDVQAFFEFNKPTQISDYKFTSLRKTFACPDGGLVMTKNKLSVAYESNKFHQFKLAASILKSLRQPEYYDDDVYLHLFEKGESLIDDEITKGMSDVSQEVIDKTDFGRVSYIRQRNAKQIVEGLKALNISTLIPITDESTPLFVPVWIADRDKVRRRMFEKQIFCPVHWPLEGLSLKKGAELVEHEMSIIIDQRYTDEDMDLILSTLEKAIR